MRLPVSWLAEWIDLPESVDALSEALTLGGVEVEAVERTGPDLSAIRVGAVLECGPHPAADRLSLCRVDVGDAEPLDIVCGAPNVAAGQKVAVATPPTRLPDGTKLKKSKIRGVVSMGMICSRRELGLGDEHEGILVLDAGAEVGKSLAELLQADSAEIEIAIMPNRGDCTSLLGIAREVRAHFGGTLRVPECTPPECGRDVAEDIRVEIEDAEGCHRYDARVVRGVRVQTSPDWVRARLEGAGLRPINNVVDIGNLVMLEFGQPLHAFDLDKLRGQVVRVRGAASGEKIETLDGASRELDPEDLVIADAAGPVAVAGVIGGAGSEVSDQTVNLLLESAHFLPARIRRSAGRLAVSTDASYRFERNVDASGTGRAVDRAARLIAEIAGGEVSSGIASAEGTPAPHCEEIRLERAHVNRLLGTDLCDSDIRSALDRLQIASTPDGADAIRCRIPSHRNDLQLPEDLIEEVARIHGYDRIPSARQTAVLTAGSAPAWWRPSERARDVLVAEGLIEVASLPFIEASELDLLGLAEDDSRRATLGVLNPLVESEAQLRSTLVPSLLRLVRDNLNRQAERVGLFEISRVFRLEQTGELPAERLWVTAVLARGDERAMWEMGTLPLFFELKGIAERLLAALGHDADIRTRAQQPYLHPGAAAEISIGRRVVGHVGELHPETHTRFDLVLPTALLELDLSELLDTPVAPKQYQAVSRHPQVRRDIAVVVDRGQAASEMLDAIRRAAGGHLHSVELFDRYEGEGIPEGKLSLAFRLVFQRSDRTLRDADVTKSMDRVIRMLDHEFHGELR